VAGFTDIGRLRNVGRKYGRLLDTLLMQRDLTA
jgi:L-amino acid N-acyltransferase YncA